MEGNFALASSLLGEHKAALYSVCGVGRDGF